MVIALIVGAWLAAVVMSLSLARVSAEADADARRIVAEYVRAQSEPADAPVRDVA